MMQPEDGIKSRYLNDAHVPQPKSVVETIVKRLEVSNSASIGLVTDLAERLVDSEQLVKHVTQVWLLLANADVDFIVATGSVCSESIRGVT